MFSQVYAPYYLAADFMVRLQREMVMQWFKGWSEAVTAVVGTGRAQIDEQQELLSRNGGGEGADGQPATPSRTTVAAEDGTAGSGREPHNIAVEESTLSRAYYKWIDEGCRDGQHLRHYFEAQHEVRG